MQSPKRHRPNTAILPRQEKKTLLAVGKKPDLCFHVKSKAELTTQQTSRESETMSSQVSTWLCSPRAGITINSTRIVDMEGISHEDSLGDFDKLSCSTTDNVTMHKNGSPVIEKNQAKVSLIPPTKRQKHNETISRPPDVISMKPVAENVALAIRREVCKDPPRCDLNKSTLRRKPTRDMPGSLEQIHSVVRRALERQHPPRGDFNMYVSLVQRSCGEDVKFLLAAIEKKISLQVRNSINKSPRNLTDGNCPDLECETIAYLTSDAYYGVSFVSLGGIATIVRAMDVFARHAKLHEACCTTLCRVCVGDEANQMALRRECGIDIICKTMISHPESLNVQSNGCLGLGSIAEVVVSLLESHEASPLRSNIIEALRLALTKKITFAARECSELLLNLSKPDI